MGELSSASQHRFLLKSYCKWSQVNLIRNQRIGFNPLHKMSVKASTTVLLFHFCAKPRRDGSLKQPKTPAKKLKITWKMDITFCRDYLHAAVFFAILTKHGLLRTKNTRPSKLVNTLTSLVCWRRAARSEEASTSLLQSWVLQVPCDSVRCFTWTSTIYQRYKHATSIAFGKTLQIPTDKFYETQWFLTFKLSDDSGPVVTPKKKKQLLAQHLDGNVEGILRGQAVERSTCDGIMTHQNISLVHVHRVNKKYLFEQRQVEKDGEKSTFAVHLEI